MSCNAARYLTALPLVGKITFVDSVFGNDANGLRQREDAPFLTCAAAKAAALSGDTIWVRPGTYAENNLLKNGVNWHFENGAIVAFSGATQVGIFDDSSVGANAAITCKITGDGRFTWTSTYASTGPGTHNGAIVITNVSSNISFEFDSVSVTGSASVEATCVNGENGTVYVRCRLIESDTVGVWWTHGPMRVNAQQITCTGTGLPVYSTPSAPSGACFVRANQIIAENYNAVQNSGHANAQLWVEALEIQSTGNGVGTDAVYNAGGKLYVTCQKLSVTTPSQQAWAVNVIGGKTWVTAQKISGDAIFAAAAAATELFVNVQQFDEDTSSTENTITIGANCTVSVECQKLTTLTSNGIALTSASAVLDFWGKIDTTATGTKNPITISNSAAVLRLHDAVLLPNGARDSIETSGGATPTVIAYGSYAKNDVDAAVTIVGDLTINASFT